MVSCEYHRNSTDGQDGHGGDGRSQRLPAMHDRRGAPRWLSFCSDCIYTRLEYSYGQSIWKHDMLKLTNQMHHLAGVGHLLGSVIQSPLSQWTYLQVRNVLLAMVDLLASLEANTSTEGGSARLKAHIQRIDAYMTNAAREKQGKEVYHSALPKEAWSNEQSLRSTVSCLSLLTLYRGQF